jgi:hypothetical protein
MLLVILNQHMGKFWAHNTILTIITFLLLLKCLYQARKVSGHVYVWGNNFASFWIFLLNFGTCPTVWYFLFFILSFLSTVYQLVRLKPWQLSIDISTKIFTIGMFYVDVKQIKRLTRTVFKKKDVRRSMIIFFYEQYFTEIT